VRLEGLCQCIITMTPSRIEPATFWLVAQCLNQMRPPCAPMKAVLPVIQGGIFFSQLHNRSGSRPLHCRCFTITLRHTLGRTPLEEGSALPETTTLQHTTQETDTPPPCGIRTRNPRKRASAHRQLRPRGHWNRPMEGLVHDNICVRYLQI